VFRPKQQQILRFAKDDNSGKAARVGEIERGGRPSYAAAFRCIGAECEDTCCGTWGIPLDKETYRRYALFPVDRLGGVVARHVTVTPGAAESLYARIEPTAEGVCPFFGEDRLCGIQREYGAEMLSATCSSYPRTLNKVDGVLEGSLMMSCPEAARQVLLTPGATEVVGDLLSAGFRTDNFFWVDGNQPGKPYKPVEAFHEVRALLVETVKDRTRPLWQRLVLVGVLCLRLNGVAKPEDSAGVLTEYEAMLRSGWGLVELEEMAGQPEVRLGFAMEMSEGRVSDTTCGRRFAETYWGFVEGVGAGGNDVARFRDAEARWHGPFFAARPWILENYLLNAMYERLFPLGRAGSERSGGRTVWEEYLLLMGQFCWVNGLLAGVAGQMGEGFAEADVVRVVQSFSREVEHDASVGKAMLEWMRRKGLDGFEGVIVLLKS
jgi:lysine-N-methylase